MSTGLRLGDYATTPLYNIKAVVQATTISPSTLRAWERRYKIARPQRSESGYRLYSERDIAIIRWLKAQVDAGMSISQAVSWLANITAKIEEIEEVVLPVGGSGAPLHDPLSALPPSYRDEVRDLHILQHELVNALAHFDEEGAEATIAEAFSLYPVERVGEQLFLTALAEIDERQRHGDLSSTVKYFTRNYLLQRLGTVLRATPNSTNGPLIWLGSAPQERHQASALLVAIHLRRAGYHVHFLGQELPLEEMAMSDLAHEVRRYQPAMILFCVSAALVSEKVGHPPFNPDEAQHIPALLGYSGPIYARNSELRVPAAGVYIGMHVKEVLQNIDELLADRHRGDKKYDKKISHTKVDERATPSLENGAYRRDAHSIVINQ